MVNESAGCTKSLAGIDNAIALYDSALLLLSVPKRIACLFIFPLTARSPLIIEQIRLNFKYSIKTTKLMLIFNQS